MIHSSRGMGRAPRGPLQGPSLIGSSPISSTTLCAVERCAFENEPLGNGQGTREILARSRPGQFESGILHHLTEPLYRSDFPIMKKIAFIESGRRRLGEYHACEQCRRKFLRRLSASNGVRRFCSHACSSRFSSSQVAVKCSTCSKQIFRSPSKLAASKSKLYFCSKGCMAKAQKLDGGNPKIHPKHYGNGLRVYRSIAARSHPMRCVDCGLSFPPLLVVHHKDGNRNNNKPSNLEFVCSNHHMLRHMKWVEGVGWMYWNSALTPRNKLKEVLALSLSSTFPAFEQEAAGTSKGKKISDGVSGSL